MFLFIYAPILLRYLLTSNIEWMPLLLENLTVIYKGTFCISCCISKEMLRTLLNTLQLSTGFIFLNTAFHYFIHYYYKYREPRQSHWICSFFQSFIVILVLTAFWLLYTLLCPSFYATKLFDFKIDLSLVIKYRQQKRVF